LHITVSDEPLCLSVFLCPVEGKESVSQTIDVKVTEVERGATSEKMKLKEIETRLASLTKNITERAHSGAHTLFSY
jgi:hypothetical protein